MEDMDLVGHKTAAGVEGRVGGMADAPVEKAVVGECFVDAPLALLAFEALV